MIKVKVGGSASGCFISAILTALSLLFISSSCSTQKNTFASRTYHQVTARYNAYFNGRESYRGGIRRMERQFVYDYNKILPVFLYTDPDIARSVAPDMDRAVSKASKVISRKSITAKPAERGGLLAGRDADFYNQSEYNRWVRESYLLAGKAHFHKHDFVPAGQAFLFIIREYSMNSVRHEAKIWLSRSYSERGRFNEARLLLDEMLNDPEFPAGLYPEVYSTKADLHLKQNQPGQAIPNLEKALDDTRDKNRRLRYTYILGQLYEITGDYQKASDSYARVVRMSPPYEMVFNARISRAGVVQAGTGETGRLINELERMLRDEKNRDYEDQIYYALGNIYKRQNNEAEAIRMYSMSASARGTNPSQKAVSYLALADIYFSRPDYLNAQAYYDSAVMDMGQGFPEREAITEKSSRLNKLASSIRAFQLEDSVQVLAAMSEAERNRKIDDIIARVREEEAEARQREMQAQQAGRLTSARPSQAARQQAERTGGGNWYFYNQSAVSFGQTEFEALWGERRLEDNWRRSNRQVIDPGQFAVLSDDEQQVAAGTGEITDSRSREYYLRNIPLTEEALLASHQKLQDALFNMAVIFKDDFNDYMRSAEAYEELVKRYPEGEYLLPAYYDLHSVNLLNNNYQRAEFYKNLIITNYPGTPYAAILSDPDFFSEYERKMREADIYYEETFEIFRAGRYELVGSRVDHALGRWPESPLVPRFEYLKTLSYGSAGNIPLFRDMLTDYIERWPGTEMADNALEFIAYLEEDYPETIREAETDEIPDIYLPDQSGEHYFTVIVDNRQDLINRMVFNIVNFNVDHFARLNLDVRSEAFSTNFRLLRVEGLPDVQTAMDYLNRFAVSEEVLADTGREDFPFFVISPGNFTIFMKDRNIGAYMNFFKDQYQNR